MRTYHIGFVDAARTPYGYPKTPGLLTVHACRDKDYLPPYILEYQGERVTTKKALRERLSLESETFLKAMNEKYPARNFTKVKVI